MPDPDAPEAADDDLPTTAYVVLGILSVTEEELAPVQIKNWATHSLRAFFPSPAVSHVRRELRRLIALGMVDEREMALGRVRTTQVYRITDAGEKALALWVTGGRHEPVVIRNAMLLRVFLGAKAGGPAFTLSLIDARIAEVNEQIAAFVWDRRQSKRLGLDTQESLRLPIAVHEYNLRALYFARANLATLRDSIQDFTETPVSRPR
jgi:DNA-binding PadR family transcriptional regulator